LAGFMVGTMLTAGQRLTVAGVPAAPRFGVNAAPAGPPAIR
jgi:hypothetical protein